MNELNNLNKITYRLSEIEKIAAQLWSEYSSKKIWAFHAEMGSGKTTFIHALCKILQVTEAVSSPTFALINEYTSPVTGSIYHMDWYRIKSEEEAIHAGCDACIESGSLCFIEWPEKFQSLLPRDTLNIEIIPAHGDKRVLKIKSCLTEQ